VDQKDGNIKPLGPIIMICGSRNMETYQSNQHLITLSSGKCTSVQLCCPFTSLYKVWQKERGIFFTSLGRFLEQGANTCQLIDPTCVYSHLAARSQKFKELMIREPLINSLPIHL